MRTWYFMSKLIIINLLCLNMEASVPDNYPLLDLINSSNFSRSVVKPPQDALWNLPTKEEREPPVPLQKYNFHIDPPKVFDVRNQWYRECGDVLSHIRNQGKCESAWAVGTVSVISDRICIASGGKVKVHLSTEDLLTCCEKCTFNSSDVCKVGGYVPEAWEYYEKEGIVTGGEVSSKQGCKPYSRRAFTGLHVSCRRTCTNRRYKKSYQQDRYFGEAYSLRHKTEKNIEREIYRRGPLLARIKMYDDFVEYKKGLYMHLIGNFRNYHYVKLMGWGVTYYNDRLIKYWLASTFYGRRWGENGIIKFIKGVDECGIKEHITAYKPRFAPAVLKRRLTIDSTNGDTRQLSSSKYIFMEILVFCVLISPVLD